MASSTDRTATQATELILVFPVKQERKARKVIYTFFNF